MSTGRQYKSKNRYQLDRCILQLNHSGYVAPLPPVHSIHITTGTQLIAMIPLYGKGDEHETFIKQIFSRTKPFSAQQTVFALQVEMGFTPTVSIGVQSIPTVTLRLGRTIPRDCRILLASAEKGYVGVISGRESTRNRRSYIIQFLATLDRGCGTAACRFCAAEMRCCDDRKNGKSEGRGKTREHCEGLEAKRSQDKYMGY